MKIYFTYNLGMKSMPSPKRKDLTERERCFRAVLFFYWKKKNYGQSDIAKICDIGLRQVQNLLTGSQGATEKRIEMFAHHVRQKPDDIIAIGRSILRGEPLGQTKQIGSLRKPDLGKYISKDGDFGIYEKLGGDLAEAIRILIESGEAGQHAFLAAAHQIMLAARQFDRRKEGKPLGGKEERRQAS